MERQLDFSLRVWGPLHSSPASSFMILWPSAESDSRHLVTSRRVRAQVSGSRRTARAPAECPRGPLSLSLCPARILCSSSSVLTWTPQSGEFERLSDFLASWRPQRRFPLRYTTLGRYWRAGCDTWYWALEYILTVSLNYGIASGPW